MGAYGVHERELICSLLLWCPRVISATSVVFFSIMKGTSASISTFLIALVAVEGVNAF